MVGPEDHDDMLLVENYPTAWIVLQRSELRFSGSSQRLLTYVATVMLVIADSAV